jgi:ketosteroid isomerase-like protein
MPKTSRARDLAIALSCAAGFALASVLGASPDTSAAADALEADRQAVWSSEEGFAAAFAARDPQRFATFVADDAVFHGGGELRGKAAIVDAWTKLMTAGPVAPFSWRPTRVLVHGDVALSSGPITGSDGAFGGAFTSVWKRQPDGTWKVAIDGAAPCAGPGAAPPAAAPTPPGG